MKKIFTLLVALTTFAIGLNATRLLTESFNYTANDTLPAGDCKQMGTDQDSWWWVTGSVNLKIADTTLMYKNYQSKKEGRAIAYAGSGKRYVRAFNTVNSGSVYYSALINVDTIKTTTSKQVMLMLTGSSTESGNKAYFAELRISYDKSGGGYKLGISKANENGFRLTDKIPFDSTILVVVRYDFVDGAKNDVASLWVNPTVLDEGSPTQVCIQDTGTVGANQRVDAPDLYRLNLSPYTTFTGITIDEMRVSDKWSDLFEGGGDEPALSLSPATKNEGYIFQGTQIEETMKVKGVKLTEDVTISNTNAEVSLSTKTISKSAAEAEATFTATLKANAEGEQADTITVVSGTLKKQAIIKWNTIGVTDCKDVAALKAAVAGEEEWSKYVRLTGEAIVTRDTVINEDLGYGSVRTLYIEDASGAVKLIDGASSIKESNLVGAKIKNIVLLNMEEALKVQPFYVQNTPTIVSTGNEVEPQVVTLAELQANAADYLLELIQVQKVTFANAGESFTSGNWEISQDSKTANVKVEMNVGITGNEIPAVANVTGFSLNTSGSVIVPRGIADIVDASEVLLKNGSFEKYKTSSSPFGSATTFEDWDLSGIFGTALAVETTDVLEGKAAFKTTSDVTAGYLYQEINLDSYATGDQFDIRICYKNLDTKDSAIVMDSYWSTSMGSTEPMPQTEELTQVLPNSQAWDTVMIRTTKPEKAKYFVLKFKFKKKALVLLDNLDFKYYEDTVPYFAVLPEKTSYSFTTNIDTDTTVAKLTIRQRNLKESVKLVWSIGTDKTVYSVSKSEVTAAEETVEVKFKSSKTGKFNGTLNIMDDESPETSLMNTTISFAATVIDPSVTPEIVVTPMEFDTFRCKAYEEVTDTIYITSSNCSEYVRCWANEQTGPDSLWGFGISDSYLLANSTDTIILTFAPKKVGNYTARLKVFTAGVDTIFINVVGVAEDGKPTPIVVDWDTTFTWDMSKPYAILNEGFDMGATLRNKTLKVTDWQNVVLDGGDRPWWGFNSDTTQQAKMTSYYSDRTDPQDVVTWLVTPALDYKNTPSQVFSFDVMSDLCFEGQTAHLELYFIDPSDPNDIFFQHIEAIDSLIPFGNSELSGNWGTILLPLMNQPFIPDVFFMAFKFYDPNGGRNGATYYVDNVTWGVKEIPMGIKEVHNAQCTMQDVHKFVNNGQLIIVKDGQRYNALGQRVR